MDIGSGMAAAASKAAEPRRKKRKQSVFWRVREEIPRPLERSLIVLSIASPLLIWTLLYLSGMVSRLFLPSPWATAEAAYEMATAGTLASDTWSSVRRVYIAFSIVLLISVPLGLAMGTFRSIRALFEPVISLVRYAPATAFVPLLLIWLGLGEEPKIALIVIGTVFFNTLMTANVVWQVPTELIKVSRTLGAGSFTVFRKVIFPHAIPGMIDAARVNLAASWNLIVVAELLAADSGLGMRIVRAQKFLQIDQIFVAIVIFGVLGIMVDFALRLLRDRLSPWSQE